VSRFPLERRLRAAAAAGYAGIGLTSFDWLASCSSRRPDEFRRIADDLGIRVAEIEALPVMGTDDPTDSLAAEQEFYEMASVLAPSHLVAIIRRPPGELLPLDAIAERFAAVCTRAREYGLRVAIEFMPFFAVSTLDVAAKIVELAGQSNGAVAVDSYHFFRGGSSLDMIGAVPPGAIAAAQTSDARRELHGTLLEDTRNHRLIPGDGELDLMSLLGAIHARPEPVPVTVEILSAELRQLEVEEAAARTFAGTRRLVDRVVAG